MQLSARTSKLQSTVAQQASTPADSAIMHFDPDPQVLIGVAMASAEVVPSACGKCGTAFGFFFTRLARARFVVSIGAALAHRCPTSLCVRTMWWARTL